MAGYGSTVHQGQRPLRNNAKDVAEAAGVSIATASFVMTGKGRISTEIRQKVLDAVDTLGYKKPNKSETEPKTQSVIGILFNIEAEWALTFGFVRPILESIDSFFSIRVSTPCTACSPIARG